MGQLEHFRHEIDEFMQHHPQSPLDHDQRHGFTGLKYYDFSDELFLEVEVERFPDDEPAVVMETSTGDRTEYQRYGNFSFEVGGEEGTLTLYIDSHGEFFLPFRGHGIRF